MTIWVRAVDDKDEEDEGEDDDEDDDEAEEDEDVDEDEEDDGEDVPFAGFTEAELAAQDLLFAQDVLSEEDLRTEGTDHRCGACAKNTSFIPGRAELTCRGCRGLAAASSGLSSRLVGKMVRGVLYYWPAVEPGSRLRHEQ